LSSRLNKQNSGKLNLVNKELELNIEKRGDWGNRAFWLLVGWLFVLVGILLFQGFHRWGFSLDRSIVITFIETTTADVLGLGYIVVNYLFPKSQ
jgi:hypothetical protein